MIVSMHDDALQYALSNANDDVRATLEWLRTTGFVVVQSSGGPDEPFGNVYLLFGGPARVEIVRDRSQWNIAVGRPGQGALYPLSVLTAARDGIEWQHPELPSGELPTQLPPGFVWRVEVPSVVNWLHMNWAPERADEAAEQARHVMRKHIG